MNKIILYIGCIVNVLQGMELERQDFVRTFINSVFPHIVVIQDDIYNRCTQNADITVVGETEQIQLKHSSLFSSPMTGGMYRYHNKGIMRKNKIFAKHFDPSYGFCNESAAIMVEGERFIIKNPFSYVEYKKFDNCLFMIKEPEIIIPRAKDGQLLESKCKYIKTFKEVTQNSTFVTCTYTGYEAIKEAIEDVEHCYDSVLDCAHQFFSEDHTAKSLALPQLSISLGIPVYSVAQVAIAAVIRFLSNNNNKDKYGLIELLVPRLEDFNLYKNILSGYKNDSL